MKRLLIYLKTADINNVINTHDKYLEDMIRQNTKKYFMSTPKGSGYFYTTKFNPDVETMELYFNCPETITITICCRQKDKLQQIISLASGLNLIKGTDYLRIEDEKNDLVGLSFFPLEEDVINSLVRVLNDETGLGRQTSETRYQRLFGSQCTYVEDERD